MYDAIAVLSLPVQVFQDLPAKLLQRHKVVFLAVIGGEAARRPEPVEIVEQKQNKSLQPEVVKDRLLEHPHILPVDRFQDLRWIKLLMSDWY